MKTIAIVARPRKDEAAQLAREIIARFPDREFLVQQHLGDQLQRAHVSDAEIAARCELMVVLGGDGTLIYGARMLAGRGVPILGINLGSLGFMTEIPVADAFPAIEQALAGKGKVDSRMKLTCRLFRDKKLILEDEVLNDVVINKSGVAKITAHETWLDGALVANYLADGVIFATPTGSTAYSLSAGGPIVHPSIDAVVVTPICPHALTQRPIVVPGDQVLGVHFPDETDGVYLTIDGQTGLPLKQGDRIEVQKSKNRVLLVRNAQLDYFGILREKLRWGQR